MNSYIKQSPMLSLPSLGGGSNSILVGGNSPAINIQAGVTPLFNSGPVNSLNFPSLNTSPDAFLFNGASNSPPLSAVDHIDYVFSDDVITNGFSIEFWFNCTKSTTSFIVTQMNPAGGDPNSCWRIERNNAGSGTIEFGINSGTGFGSSEYVSSNFPDNEWLYCVCTFESGTAKIYKNGSIDSTFSATTSPSHQGNNIVRLGARMDSTPFAYGGQIAEFRLWKKVITDIQVLNTWTSRKTNYGL